MSMDEQYAQMLQFHNALHQFNDHLRASIEGLGAQHELVSPHWQDEMRRTYDAHWNPLAEAMRTYLQREGPSYLEFLARKLRYMEGYLYGRH